MVAAKTMTPAKLAALRLRAEATRTGRAPTAASKATPWLTLLAISSPRLCERFVMLRILHAGHDTGLSSKSHSGRECCSGGMSPLTPFGSSPLTNQHTPETRAETFVEMTDEHF